jgi:hypothetical protein
MPERSYRKARKQCKVVVRESDVRNGGPLRRNAGGLRPDRNGLSQTVQVTDATLGLSRGMVKNRTNRSGPRPSPTSRREAEDTSPGSTAGQPARPRIQCLLNVEHHVTTPQRPAETEGIETNSRAGGASQNSPPSPPRWRDGANAHATPRRPDR